jgi:hypothetical protein
LFREFGSDKPKKMGILSFDWKKSILLIIFVIPLTKTGGYLMNFSHLANKLRSKITRFSGILSQDLDKTARRFVREAVYGIMASQSVMLTEIGRQLIKPGIWVIDRGGDRDALYGPLLHKQRDFIIRLVGSRDLIHNGHQGRALWLAVACRLTCKRSIVRIIHGKEYHFNLRIGSVPVKLPGMETPLNMVVVAGFSKNPMMLLTSLKIESGDKDLWFIVQAYMKRWGIEETIRFIKQTYDLENIRVLKYTRLQNMMALLLAVFFFISVVLDQSQKLSIMAGHILKNAKRVFGIPDFKYYALGDGLFNIFSQFPGSLQNHQILKHTQPAFGFT